MTISGISGAAAHGVHPHGKHGAHGAHQPSTAPAGAAPPPAPKVDNHGDRDGGKKVNVKA